METNEMSYTPETDEFAHAETCLLLNHPMVTFARKLERERNELQKAVNGLCEHIGVSPANTTLLAVQVLRIERERDEWKAKFIQQNKDLGCEMMDPNGSIWDYAKKVQRELTVVTKQRNQLEERLRVELGGHPDSELWGDAGLIAATMRCVDALDAVTEQRDRLAEALIKCREDSVCEQVRMEKCRYTKAADESQANIDRADKALQYLNQPTKP
jgi:hypothetical protein